MSAMQGRKHALTESDPFRAAEMVEDLSGESEGRQEISLPALRGAV